MTTTTATTKFALATLAAPVLAALAIGMAGAAHATPAGSQPSDTGTTATANLHQHKDNPTQVPVGAANATSTKGKGDKPDKVQKKPMLGAQATSPKLTVVGTATPGTPVADIDRWTRAVTDYTNYGNFLDGTGNFLNG